MVVWVEYEESSSFSNYSSSELEEFREVSVWFLRAPCEFVTLLFWFSLVCSMIFFVLFVFLYVFDNTFFNQLPN